MVIPQFNIRLNGPTSTTKQLEVATRFGGEEGINNNGYNGSHVLHCWNCSWLSNYIGEDEYLFVGGNRQIKIESIRLINGSINYDSYMFPLYYFDCMISGIGLRKIQIPNIIDSDYLLIYN